MQWRRVAESDLEGFTSAELRAIAALWKNADRRLDVRFGGASMQPTIAAGDTLTLHCTDDVAQGDVIVYVFLDQIIAHRLLIRRGDWFLTRGDAHTVPDPPQRDASAIVGKLIDVPSPPRSFLRALALAIVRAASLFGVRGATAAVAVMQWMSRALR